MRSPTQRKDGDRSTTVNSMVIPLMKAEMDYIKGGIQEESISYEESLKE